MKIKEMLKGCINVNGIEYPEDMSIKEISRLAGEVERVPKCYLDRAFHIDALINNYIPNSCITQMESIPIGSKGMVMFDADAYDVTRVSEHFYVAEIAQVEIQYNYEQNQNQNVCVDECLHQEILLCN